MYILPRMPWEKSGDVNITNEKHVCIVFQKARQCLGSSEGFLRIKGGVIFATPPPIVDLQLLHYAVHFSATFWATVGCVCESCFVSQ